MADDTTFGIPKIGSFLQHLDVMANGEWSSGVLSSLVPPPLPDGDLWDFCFQYWQVWVLISWIPLLLTPTKQIFSRPGVLIASSIVSFLYLLIAIQASITHTASFDDFKTLDSLAAMFSHKPAAFGALAHFLSMDLLVGHAIAFEFYSKYNDSKLSTRIIFFLNLLICTLYAPIGFLLYLILRATVYEKDKKFTDPFRQESYVQILQNRLRDKVPEPHQFIHSLPWFLRYVVYMVVGAIGLFLLLNMMGLYFVYTTICVLLWTATFHSPFEGTKGKSWPLKAVVVCSGHFRILWLSLKTLPFVRFLRLGFPYFDLLGLWILRDPSLPQDTVDWIGTSISDVTKWSSALLVRMNLCNDPCPLFENTNFKVDLPLWNAFPLSLLYAIVFCRVFFCILPLVVQFGTFAEFIPFFDNKWAYFEALEEVFGDVVPFGDGLCFTSHAKCKENMESRSIIKGPESFGWKVSNALYLFSSKTTIFLPQNELERPSVLQGRRVVKTWIRNAMPTLRKERTRKRLTRMLPFRPADGTMISADLAQKAFGSAFFHLQTGGELKKEETDHYKSLIDNIATFVPEWLNFFLFGGKLERTTTSNLTGLREALLRYPLAEPLQEALKEAGMANWDDAETIRFLTVIFSVAGAAGPAKLTSNVIRQLYDNPVANLPLYESDKLRFIKEVGRLTTAIAVVSTVSSKPNMTVLVAGKNVTVPVGTQIHCSVLNANRDQKVFGLDADQFNPNRESLYENLTFNGSEKFMMSPNPDEGAPRGCPGHSILPLVEFLVDLYKPQLDHPRVDDMISSFRFKSIMKHDLTLFTKLVVEGGKAYHAMWNKHYPHASDALHPMDSLHGSDLGHEQMQFGDTIPTFDEDDPPNPIIPVISAVLQSPVPVHDPSGDWNDADEALGFRIKVLGNLYPERDIVVSDWSTNEHLSQLAFASCGCFHTRKIAPNENLPGKPHHAVYVNETLSLSNSEVRDGFQRYGAAAYFDANFNIVGIFTCFNQQTSFPINAHGHNDVLCTWPWKDKLGHRYDGGSTPEEWKHATTVWKNSLLAMITVVDHLGKTHLIESNALVSATRSHLSIHHPLRALAKIFTFRTISINYTAFKTLTVRKGLVERIWAFQGDALQDIFKGLKDSYVFKLLPENIPESMRSLSPDDYPVNSDTLTFWAIVRSFTFQYLNVIYSNESQIMLDDEMLSNCLDELAERLKLNRDTDLDTIEKVADVFASLFCTVTGYHEHVGQVSDYFWSPDLVGTTLRDGKEMDSIQTYALLTSLVSATGLRVPALLGNWEHLLQRDIFASETVPLLQEFQSNLEQLAEHIDLANKGRRFPMETFNPRVMESSVSV